MEDLTFYINKFIFTLCNQEPDLSFIPPNIRRRLNLLDKHIIYSINECMNEKVETIVFSSQYGGFDRMLKIIEQYREFNEVSPTVFSASVHNYSCGQYTLLTQNSIPTLALAGRENSFIEGLISAISLQKPLVYCYADYFGDIKTICFSVSTKETPNKFVLRKAKNTLPMTNFGEITDLFTSKINKIQTGRYTIERINNE